jgi:DNA-binding Xre family transcriptional regulator
MKKPGITRKTGAMDWVETQLRDPKARKAIEALVNEMSFEQDLIALRETRELSQRELARRAGIAQPMIARIESGKAKNLELKTLARLAAALGARINIELRPMIATKRSHSRAGRRRLAEV